MKTRRWIFGSVMVALGVAAAFLRPRPLRFGMMYLCVAVLWMMFGSRRFPRWVTRLILFAVTFEAAGWMWRLLDVVWMYDHVAHLVGTAAGITPAVLWLHQGEEIRGRRRTTAFWFSALGIGLAAGLAWEMYEWTCDQLIAVPAGQMGLTDTLSDLMGDGLGALVAAALCIRELRPRTMVPKHLVPVGPAAEPVHAHLTDEVNRRVASRRKEAASRPEVPAARPQRRRERWPERRPERIPPPPEPLNAPHGPEAERELRPHHGGSLEPPPRAADPLDAQLGTEPERESELRPHDGGSAEPPRRPDQRPDAQHGPAPEREPELRPHDGGSAEPPRRPDQRLDAQLGTEPEWESKLRPHDGGSAETPRRPDQRLDARHGPAPEREPDLRLHDEGSTETPRRPEQRLDAQLGIDPELRRRDGGSTEPPRPSAGPGSPPSSEFKKPSDRDRRTTDGASDDPGDDQN